MPLRVVVFANDVSTAGTLSAEVDALPECRVVGAGVPADDGIETASADVAAWDLGAELLAARDQISRLREVDLPVLALGPAALRAEAMAAGAAGYLGRDTAGARLRAALEAVALDLQVTDRQGTESAPPPEMGVRGPGSEELTSREMDVLRWLVEGLPNKEIARRLGISEHTVKFHVAVVLGKLDARTRTEAVTRAIRQGLVVL
jgi:two-component system, NarL family, nitrate/nitrite response regulator NarL